MLMTIGCTMPSASPNNTEHTPMPSAERVSG